MHKNLILTTAFLLLGIFSIPCQCNAQAGINPDHFASILPFSESIKNSEIASDQTFLDNLFFSNVGTESEEHSVMIQPKIQWHSALFCKIEDQISKNLPIQFKFRLGNQDYVDYLEGKNRGGLSFLNDNN